MLKKDLLSLKPAIIPIIIYCAVMQYFFGTVCPLRAFTGIKCPGCGLTHAAFYLFTGRIEESLRANPTCIFWLISFGLFIIDRYIKPLRIKPFPLLFIITGIITIVWYFIDICLHLI